MMLSSIFSSWLVLAALCGRTIAASNQNCPQPTVTPSCTEEYFRSQGALPCQFNVTIELVQPVQNGNFGEASTTTGYQYNATHLPDGLCAVIIQVTDSVVNPPSSYRLGLFLPSNDQWNGRFLTVGNDGFVGAINWPEMGQGPHYGAAAMSTDTGHSSGNWISTWAPGNPGAKLDWGWRAMNGSVTIAKAVVETFYGGRKIGHSFYAGCSTGGRQGLKQLEVAPDSFDGVLIGAPAWDQKQYMPWIYYLGYMDLNSSLQVVFDASVDAAIVTLVLDAYATCDSADGLHDNIISAPENCKVNLAAITCPSGTPNSPNTTCLQPEQATVVQNVYDDWVLNKTVIMEGFEPGSELSWGWFLSPYGALYFVEQWPMAFLYDSSSGWPGGVAPDPAKVAADAAARDPGDATVDPTSANLASYGGKMILYQGLADDTIPPRSTTRLFNTMQAHRSGGGAGAQDDSLLYFPVPGMGHCFNAAPGTNAPWVFGGAGQATVLQDKATATTPDWVQSGWGTPGQFQNQSRYDALLALMEWVEGEVAGVSNVTAVAFNDDWTVNRTRPLCPYPKKQVPRTGSGVDLDNADNWTCQ